MAIDFEKDLAVRETCIPGMLVFDLAVHGDSRGWFKENWQREKMCALGLPDLGPVQNNISFNAQRGVTRGIHAEPWDKYISVATGSVFGAWVDLRPGESFGRVFTCVIDPSKAIYVPRGVGNSFQALEDGTAYTYLVNAHWSAELKKTYMFVNLADPELAIEWPIPLSECELSAADQAHPMLADVTPMAPLITLVIGSDDGLGGSIKDVVQEIDGLRPFEFVDLREVINFGVESSIQHCLELYDSIVFCGLDFRELNSGFSQGLFSNFASLLSELISISSENRLALYFVSLDFDSSIDQIGHLDCAEMLALSTEIALCGSQFATMVRVFADDIDVISATTKIRGQLNSFSLRVADGPNMYKKLALSIINLIDSKDF